MYSGPCTFRPAIQPAKYGHKLKTCGLKIEGYLYGKCYMEHMPEHDEWVWTGFKASQCTAKPEPGVD